MKLFRKSVEMWQVKLEALISSESQEMTKVFNQAFEYLKPQICLPCGLVGHSGVKRPESKKKLK